MHDLLKTAAAELGQKEIKGPKDNPRIVKYAKESGITWVQDDETPWCSTFMNWVAFQAGVQRTDKANARSWLTVGKTADPPEPGDVVVFWRESRASAKGHVGLFLGYSHDGKRVYVLGGNQGDQVGISAYDAERVLGFRRLGSTKLSLPDPVLKQGSVGDAVVRLQDALKLAGFAPGTSDGIFGDKTKVAVQDLQSTSDEVKITGAYNNATKALLEAALQDQG